MPKIKTLKSAVKRFKKTSSGKFKHKQANLRHLLTKKCNNKKRKLRIKKVSSKNDLSCLKLFLPYS